CELNGANVTSDVVETTATLFTHASMQSSGACAFTSNQNWSIASAEAKFGELSSACDIRDTVALTVASVHQRVHKIAPDVDHIVGSAARAGNNESSMAMMGVTVTKKVAAVALLCAVVALVACRREEYRPLKLGGPVAEQPAR